MATDTRTTEQKLCELDNHIDRIRGRLAEISKQHDYVTRVLADFEGIKRMMEGKG